jgi:hypothetical protein
VTVRYLLEVLVLFIGLSALFVLALKWIKVRRQITVAYFSGGQLDGGERKMRELPTLVTHGEEVYRKEVGAPIYIYIGEAHEKSALSYEVK